MDPKLKCISRLSMALVVALIAGCAGPEGPAGAAGANGTNGANGAAGTTGANGTNGTNGAPCTVAAYDGGVTVTCPGSAPVVVPNGTDGASCTVANFDGGVTVSCPGSSPVTVLNGNNGTAGQTGLGLSTGLKVVVTSVSNTAPIAVRFRVLDDRDNPVDLNGKYSINTPFVPRFSLAWIPTGNAPVTDAGIVLAYNVLTQTGSATAATSTDPAPAPASVVTQPTNLTPTFPIPTAGVPATDAAMKGLLVENGTGFGDYTYTFPTGGNTQIRNSANRFVTSVVDPVAFDATRMGTTHTIWIQIARQTDIINPSTVQGFTPLDVEHNFIPNGVGTPIKREIVTQAACNKCHNGFRRDLNPNETLPTVNGFHGGGRVQAPFCNTCHNPDRTNQAALSGVFVHRLHGAHNLVGNPDGGVPVDAFHGIQVSYPQDIRSCDTCHGGAQNGAQATNNPTLAVCGSCHNGVDFAAASALPTCTNPATRDADHRFVPCKHQGGAQANSAMCAQCHGGPASLKPLALSHLAVLPPDPLAVQPAQRADGGWGTPDGGPGSSNVNAAYIAAANDVPPGAAATTYDVKEVKVVSGKPQIVFKLKQSIDGATPVDVDFGTYVAVTNTELIPGFVGGPSAYFAFSVPQDGILSPADFNASASCYIKNAWNGTALSGTSACTLLGKDAQGYYTLEMTNVNIPATAKMLTGGVGYTYNIQSARPLTQVNLAAYPYAPLTATGGGIGGLIVAAPNVWKVATTYTARRAVVETARCNTCHAQLGVGPTFHAGQRNDAQTCTFCHTPNRTSAGWAANMKDMVHSIHGGRIRTVEFNWHAISEDENFSEVEFPSNVNNCQACHSPGTYDFTLASTVTALPNMLPSTAAQGKYDGSLTTNPTGWFTISPYVVADNVFDYGAGFSFNVTTNVTTAPAATTLVKTPITAACSACHDADATIGHMEAMGGAFYKPRSSLTRYPAVSANWEQCLICHGPGTIAPITLMHK